MASPDSSGLDQSLLNRLNALKPTSISLKTNPTHGPAATLPATATATSTLTGSTSFEVEKKTLSREDALAERLRVLRNNSTGSTSTSQPENTKQSSTNLPASSSSVTDDAQPPCSATPPIGGNIPKEQQQQQHSTSSQKISSPVAGIGERSISHAENPKSREDDDNDDYRRFLESLELVVDPDQTLDELLDGLGDEFHLDDEDFDEPPTLSEFDPAREAKKVSDLREQFRKENNISSRGVPATETDDDGHAVAGKVSGKQAPPQQRADGHATAGANNDDDKDDDSEGERMAREVEKILSQVRDDLGVASEEDSKTGETGVSSSDPAPEANDTARTSPTRTTAQKEEEGEPSGSGAEVNSDHPVKPVDAATSSFSLPDAPASPLRDIPPSLEGVSKPKSKEEINFENEMVTRLASLRGLGSGINVDSFGLPVAPTFSPQDHLAKKTPPKGVGRAGYTDEDQKTWCIVCLDDATIKCIGCDNDVYCGRCWRDMHVGPSAGYDERGHQWVKFVRR